MYNIDTGQLNNEIKKITSSIYKKRKDIESVTLDTLRFEALRSIDKNFEVGGREPAWKPSKKNSKQKKQGKTKTLINTSALRRVIGFVQGNRIVVGTDPRTNAYAEIHQLGGTINRKSKVKPVRKMKSGRTVFAKESWAKNKKKGAIAFRMIGNYTINMPSRRYLYIPKSDYPVILNAIKRRLKL
mgnify:CR=1 FL=1